MIGINYVILQKHMYYILNKSLRILINQMFIFYILQSLFVKSLFLLFVTKAYDLMYLINLVYTGLIALGTAIFANNTLKNEFARKFHV